MTKGNSAVLRADDAHPARDVSLCGARRIADGQPLVWVIGWTDARGWKESKLYRREHDALRKCRTLRAKGFDVAVSVHLFGPQLDLRAWTQRPENHRRPDPYWFETVLP
jgi:hypothetical protein